MRLSLEGMGNRAISRMLGVPHATVDRYVRLGNPLKDVVGLRRLSPHAEAVLTLVRKIVKVEDSMQTARQEALAAQVRLEGLFNELCALRENLEVLVNDSRRAAP